MISKTEGELKNLSKKEVPSPRGAFTRLIFFMSMPNREASTFSNSSLLSELKCESKRRSTEQNVEKQSAKVNAYRSPPPSVSRYGEYTPTFFNHENGILLIPSQLSHQSLYIASLSVLLFDIPTNERI